MNILWVIFSSSIVMLQFQHTAHAYGYYQQKINAHHQHHVASEILHHHNAATNESQLHHKKAWQVLESVEGLKNEHVMMVVSSTAALDAEHIRSRIIASSRTWMRFFANVLVVIEDSFTIRFDMRHCEMIKYGLYTTFNCHNEPTYLLSRCRSTHYAPLGACCLMDTALTYITNHRRNDLLPQLKYLLYSDDDVYWRPDQTLRWLAAVERASVNDYPVIANAEDVFANVGGVSHIQGCNEIHTGGNYKLLMLNNKALNEIRKAVGQHAIESVCRAFAVSYDRSIGIIAWMYGFFHMQIPKIALNFDNKGVSALKGLWLAIQGVKNRIEENCAHGEKWGHWRYNQSVVVGCGDINFNNPLHRSEKSMNMYDVWQYFQHHGKDIKFGKANRNGFKKRWVVIEQDHSGIIVQHIAASAPKELPNDLFTIKLLNGSNFISKKESFIKQVVPALVQLEGYNGTNHSKKFKVQHEWRLFTPHDCNPQGRIIKNPNTATSQNKNRKNE